MPVLPSRPAPQSSPNDSEIIRSGVTVSLMTLLSRIFGFARDQIFAIVFGVAPMTDAFIVAFKIPNMFRRFSGEGAFAQAFVPVFTEYRQKYDAARVRDLAAHVSGTLGGLLLLLTALGGLAAPWLILLFAPGFVGNAEYDAAVTMLRLTFPYLFFISLVAYAGGILNSYGRFAVPAVTPVLLNVCLIVAALYFADLFDPPVMAAAIGVLVAGLVQLLFQLPFLARVGALPRPRWNWRHSGVQKIFKLMLPVIFGSSMAQISLLLDTIIASFLVTGSVTWLYFSERLVEFPLALFGIALATVILPQLSRQHTLNAPEKFNRTLDTALRLGLVISLPAMLGLGLLAVPILTTLFQYGEFSPHDIAMSARSLIAYALALPGFVLIKLLIPGFSARQDTRTPVRIGARALLVKIVLSTAIVGTMVFSGYDAPHVGLALATALFAWSNAGMLYVELRRQTVYAPSRGWTRFLLRIGCALLAMLLLLSSLLPPPTYWADALYWQRGLRLLGLILAAGGCYIVTLLLLGLRPRHFQP